MGVFSQIQTEIIEMYTVDGMSEKEIAESVGVTELTVHCVLNEFETSKQESSPLGRNLSPSEVDTLLGALENLLTITSTVKPEGFNNPWDFSTFVKHRDMANLVLNKSVRTIDGNEED